MPDVLRARAAGQAIRRADGRTYTLTVALVRDFPLFPLGIVALPSELVPLHIFEERYKTMMARCEEEESEFGIVWVVRRRAARLGRLRVRDRRGARADGGRPAST